MAPDMSAGLFDNHLLPGQAVLRNEHTPLIGVPDGATDEEAAVQQHPVGRRGGRWNRQRARCPGRRREPRLPTIDHHTAGRIENACQNLAVDRQQRHAGERAIAQLNNACRRIAAVRKDGWAGQSHGNRIQPVRQVSHTGFICGIDGQKLPGAFPRSARIVQGREVLQRARELESATRGYQNRHRGYQYPIGDGDRAGQMQLPPLNAGRCGRLFIRNHVAPEIVGPDLPPGVLVGKGGVEDRTQ